MKSSKKKQIHRMEVEDDLGISRGRKYKFCVPIKVYKWIKLGLIIAIPVAYFIYSPLLFLILFAYFGMIFLTKREEKVMNAGLKKDLYTYLPKFDSVLALLVVIIALVGVFVSGASQVQHKPMFDGMEQGQMEEIADAKDFSEINFKWMNFKSKFTDFATMLTGKRLFFTSANRFGRGGFGAEDFGEMQGREPPEDAPKNTADFMSNLPFQMIFSSILKSVEAVLVFLVSGCGLIALFKIRKIKSL